MNTEVTQQFLKSHLRLTRALKSYLINWERSLTTVKFESLMSEMSDLYRQTQAELLAEPEGEARAHKLHQLMEAAIDSVSHIQSSCEKACAACCHFEVEVTSDEASLLSNIVMSGHPVDANRLVKQSRRTSQDHAWQTGVVEDNRCIFLSTENICSIYVDRPSACRRHSVLSPPSLCSDLMAEPVSRHIPIAEIILSAAMGLPGTKTGALSKMLTDRLEILSIDPEQSL